MKYILILLISTIVLSSCNTLNRSRMLKTPKDYEYTKFPDSTIYHPYMISDDDIITLKVFSNHGFKPVNLGGTGNNQNNTSQNGYRVQNEGVTKIPVIGNVKLSGLSIREAEKILEEKFGQFYIDPFVIIEITNKRVYLFQGGNSASVVQLTNENTTLFEVLALAGGITANGDAKNIKIIRGDLRDPTIYKIDLSKVENLAHTDLIMQANDIIYVDPFINIANNITSDIGSALGLISSLLLVFNLINNN